MTLDGLISRDAARGLDPGMPMPVVVKCGNGHTARLSPITTNPSSAEAMARPVPRCAICGASIPRQKGAQPRRSCSAAHKRLIEVRRAAALKAHQGPGPFVFVLEAQDWYMGAAAAFQPRELEVDVEIPADLEAPVIPAAWLDGFRALYPALPEPAPVLPSTFPAIADVPDDPGTVRPRRYRRRKPRVAPAPEQLMPYPVPQP